MSGVGRSHYYRYIVRDRIGRRPYSSRNWGRCWECSFFNPVRLSSEAMSTSMSRKKAMMTVRFSELIESFNMIQHVVGPIYLHGGTLDLVATFSDTQLSRIVIDPAEWSPTTAWWLPSWRCTIGLIQLALAKSGAGRRLSAFREAIRRVLWLVRHQPQRHLKCSKSTMVVCVTSPIVSPRSTRHVPRSDRYRLG